MEIRPIDQADRKEINAFILRHWFTMEMVVHGESIDLSDADGWFASEKGKIVGLITYRFIGSRMEILSLDSLKEKNGIGTLLLDEAVREAKSVGCTGAFLTTTNDNLNALRFYQKRGFDLTRLCRNAVEKARKMKPEIPLTGMDGIPLKHEIELEMTF